MAVRSLICPAPGCGKTFEARHPNAKYCSTACRVRAHKSPAGSAGTPAAQPAANRPKRRRPQLAVKTRATLTKARRMSSHWGELALILAEEIDQLSGGSAQAALAREYASAMERALRDAKADDPTEKIIDSADRKVASLDEVGKRRERRSADRSR